MLQHRRGWLFWPRKSPPTQFYVTKFALFLTLLRSLHLNLFSVLNLFSLWRHQALTLGLRKDRRSEKIAVNFTVLQLYRLVLMGCWIHNVMFFNKIGWFLWGFLSEGLLQGNRKSKI
ncbi:hypothetical protein BFS86_03090 [Shewanella algae]|nr:hypothetical protein BFS86_03090 [Shewanella algae]